MPWNSSSSNNWNNASLKTYLNGDYYNNIETTSKNMISEETYYLGGPTTSNYTPLTASGYYNAERDSSQVYSGNPASTTQHIGLMYPSDYGYAAGERCLSTALYDYDSSCKNSDYLFSGGDEWLQAPSASNSINAAVLLTTGRVYGYGYYAEYGSSAVRPVLYLNSNVKIIGGDGSQNNPFSLGSGTSTSILEKPSFKETETNNGKTVTINYPSGCGNNLKCTYQKDNGEVVNVTSKTVDVEFTDSGSLAATVSDGTNTESSSYTATVLEKIDMGGQKVEVVTSGDGLYADENDAGKYIYKGTNLNNYITFNNETWRILSIESDNTIKIVRNEDLGYMAWDEDGSNVWENASLNRYLNNDYYNSLDNLSRNSVVEHSFNIGKVSLEVYGDGNFYISDYNAEKNAQWTGKIGLMTPSEYETAYIYLGFDMNNNYTGLWTINAYSDGGVNCGWNYICTFSDYGAYDGYGFYNNSCLGDGSYPSTYNYYKVLPTLYLTSNITLSGVGSSSDPYVITN